VIGTKGGVHKKKQGKKDDCFPRVEKGAAGRGHESNKLRARVQSEKKLSGGNISKQNLTGKNKR